MKTDCPMHDHGVNVTHDTQLVKAPCGCEVWVTVTAQVRGRPSFTRPVVEAPPTEARCDEPRTPHGVVRCYHPTGHPGPHSWEKTT